MSISKFEKTYELGFDIFPEHYIPYLNFVERRCIEKYGRSISSIEVLSEVKTLKLNVIDEDRDASYDIALIAERKPKLIIRSSKPVSTEVFLDFAIDFQFFTYQFTSFSNEGTLGLVFIPGLPIIPLRQLSLGKQILAKIFSGNLLMLYLILLFFGYLMFVAFREYAPIAIVASQFILFLSAPKLLSYVGDWILSPENRDIHVAICKIPINNFRELVTKRWNEIKEIKRKIYERTFGKGMPLSPEIVSEVLERWNVKCPSSKVNIRTIHLYDLIEEVVRVYNVPMPKTIIANTFIPNAATTGPILRYTNLLVTTGLTLTLNDDEIKAVIGHELSHAINRDPLMLFIFTSIEYLIRVYVLWGLKWPFDLIYFFFSITALYFVAKFLEARADLEAAYKLKSHKTLINALMKIGFYRLFYERYKSYRLQRWIGWDPHPPVYFRILRLEKIDLSRKPKSFILKSARDCISGFISTIIS
ncbi:MAG: M48 family metalloprotease [archaeon GB-1867-035]|nr:M48 family metalloprotease [Candidatus Culexmicrobium profundum]